MENLTEVCQYHRDRTEADSFCALQTEIGFVSVFKLDLSGFCRGKNICKMFGKLLWLQRGIGICEDIIYHTTDVLDYGTFGYFGFIFL